MKVQKRSALKTGQRDTNADADTDPGILGGEVRNYAKFMVASGEPFPHFP